MKTIRFLFIMAALLSLSSYLFAERLPRDLLSIGQQGQSQEQVGWRSLKVGMTQDEVRHILGYPAHITDDYSDNPTWYYSDSSGYVPYTSSNVRFGTTGQLWNQKKRVLVEWEEPIN